MEREVREIQSLSSWLSWRTSFVTASSIGSLFNVHPHLTLADLVAEKRGEIRGQGDNPSMRAGRLLEPACIVAINEEKPEWHVSKANTFHILPTHRLACTPDAFGDDGLLVQCKTVSPEEWNRWRCTAPLHYLLQVCCELLVTDARRGVLAFLVRSPSYPLYLFDVPRHEAAERRILDAVAEFWRKWDAGEHPVTQAPDGLAELLDDGSTIDLSSDNQLPALLEERELLKFQISVEQKRCGEIDYKIKNRIGKARYASLPGWELSFTTSTRREVTIPAKTIRTLRVKRSGEESEYATE